jgi:hypothetical protein
MTRSHQVVAALACVLLPGASWLDGHGSFAWTMYSASSSYRLELTEVAPDATRRAIAPLELVRFVGRDEAPLFVGADQYRMVASRGLRLRLAEVAALGCRLASPPSTVEATLWTRRSLDAEPVARVERVRCETVEGAP